MSLVKRQLEELEEVLEEEDDLVEELEQDEALSEVDTESNIEAKYDSGQARIVIQRNDFLVPNIMQMLSNKDILDLSPTYQRRSRWNAIKQSHLIESLLMNVPIPPIFLYERDLAKYEVMDGQQRLSAIRDFVDNRFALRHLTKWPELNGRRYVDLPSRIQAGLMRRGVAAVIILTESGQDVEAAIELRQYVFERLNTGGESLNAQEMRNCIYASPFNEMLIRLARSDLFTSAWGIPPKESTEPHKVSKALAANRLYATMSDCEIALRYFAFKDLSSFKSGVKRTLDRHMRDMRSLDEAACRACEEEYISLLGTASRIFGERVFRLPGKSGDLDGRRSIPLSDALLLGLHAVRGQAATLVSKSSAILDRLRDALNDEKTHEAIVGRGNTRQAIEERIGLMRGLLQTAIA